MNTIETASADSKNIRADYLETASERAALSTEQLLTVNVDVQQAVTTALKAVKKLTSLRAEVATLPKVDMVQYDKIAVYGQALRFAQNRYVAASSPREILPEMIDSAMKVREILLAETKSLLARGVIDRRPIDGLKGGNGYSSVAQDLGALVEVLRDHADEVSAKVMSLVDEAEDASEAINGAIVKRGDQESALGTVSDERQRAFTLLFRAYDEARRAVAFLRWHEGDVDTLVPSLYAGRGRGSKSDNEPEAPAPVDPSASTSPVCHSQPPTRRPSCPACPAARPSPTTETSSTLEKDDEHDTSL